MTDQMPTPGKTTVAPEVLVTIAQLAASNVSGVRLSPMPSGVKRFYSRSMSDDGVRIVVENDAVYAEMYVIVQRDENVRDISRSIQSHVARAITEMVGMEVGKVNIHIEDIDYDMETLTSE
jgi:uncharacterized alkaline shock family protein YloU